MRTLLGMLMVLVVSGVDTVRFNVTGFIGEDVLLPCICLNRDWDKEFKWQTKGKISEVVVKHNWNASEFIGNYSGRAELFVSENISNCSLLLRNITPEDEKEYTCIFRYSKGQYDYAFGNLTVSKRVISPMGQVIQPSPVPTESTSPDNIRTLCRVMPVALLVVLSLFLLYNWKVSRRLNAGKGETEPSTSV